MENFSNEFSSMKEDDENQKNNELASTGSMKKIKEIKQKIGVKEKTEKVIKHTKEKIVGLLIGNKCDLDNEREVNYEEAKSFSDNNHLGYYEVSAKLDKNIKKVIASLLQEIIDYKANYEILNSTNSDENFQLNPEKLKEESFCSRFCKKLNPKNWFWD